MGHRMRSGAYDPNYSVLKDLLGDDYKYYVQ